MNKMSKYIYNEKISVMFSLIYIYIYIGGSLNKFPDIFFCMDTFIGSTHMKL